MTSLLYYLLQVMVSSGILYLYYQFFLRNKRFHQYNRFYLLGTVIVSIIIPFLRIPVYFTHEDSTSSIVLRTLTILGSSNEEMALTTGNLNNLNNSSHYTIDLIYCFYALIAALAFGRIIIGLIRIKALRKRNPAEKLGNIFFINTSDSHAPFSFFNRLFWHRDIELKSEKGEQIFRHELFHIRQRHSVDIVFLEIVSMVFWINPFFHLIKKEIRAIHEFLADRYALDKCEQWNYAETLLMHALQTKQSLVNPFFHNQIKRRIAMITNPKKTSHQYLRKMLVLPVAAVIVTLFAFSYRKNNPVLPASEAPITVIIDAGHGGIDPGVRSPDTRHIESEITLSLGKIIQQLAPQYNIKVIMTREDANLPGGATNKDDGLKKRVEISDAVNPLLFISLHMNYAAGNSFFQDKYSGIEAYVTNKRKDDPGKLAASAILQELSNVYTTAQDLKFKESSGVYVLDKNKCGTVLLECGYINNQKDLDFVTKEANQEKIAHAILKGLVTYNKSLAFQPVPALQATDSLPHSYTIDGKVDFSGGLSFKAENITIKTNEVPSGQSYNPKLIVLNGSLLTLVDAKNTFNNATVRNAEIQILAANNSAAISKYGDRAKDGVIVIENAVMEKKAPKLLTTLKLDGAQGEPLIVLDGKVLIEDAEKTMKSLDPNTIESINVLKDQSATDKYKEKGKNGVIEIITKKKDSPSSTYLQPGDTLIVKDQLSEIVIDQPVVIRQLSKVVIDQPAKKTNDKLDKIVTDQPAKNQ